MPKKSRTWILVMDSGRAKILARGDYGRFDTVASEACADARNRTRDIVTDRRGRHPGGGASRHAMDPETTPRRVVGVEFVRSIARRIDAAAAHDAFDGLVVIAPAKTLGDLRATLSDGTRGRIRAEIDKDLVGLKEHELEERLNQVMSSVTI